MASASVVTMMATESRLPDSAAARPVSDRVRACCDASTAAAFMSRASRTAVDWRSICLTKLASSGASKARIVPICRFAGLLGDLVQMAGDPGHGPGDLFPGTSRLPDDRSDKACATWSEAALI